MFLKPKTPLQIKLAYVIRLIRRSSYYLRGTISINNSYLDILPKKFGRISLFIRVDLDSGRISYSNDNKLVDFPYSLLELIENKRGKDPLEVLITSVLEHLNKSNEGCIH